MVLVWVWREDNIQMSLRNAQRVEVFVPPTCLRPTNATVEEIVSSYTSVLSVGADQLPIWEGELTRVQEELRQEFSVQQA